MSFISSLLVHEPLNISMVGALFAGIYVVLRFSGLGEGRRPALLLLPAVLWELYAAWEWLVMTRNPEANIRVDLMFLLPVIVGISVWFVVKALREAATPS